MGGKSQLEEKDGWERQMRKLGGKSQLDGKARWESWVGKPESPLSSPLVGKERDPASVCLVVAVKYAVLDLNLKIEKNQSML